MPFLLFLLAVAGGAKLLSDQQALSNRVAHRRSLEVDPRFVPATIYTPEFYASLAKRHNRPFLGK